MSFAANLLQGLAFNLYLHLPGFLAVLGADEVRMGLLFSLTAATALLAKPPVGRLIDVEGRRVVILVGGVANVVVCLLYATITTLGPWLYAVRIAHGVAEAMLFAALTTYAADFVPASRRAEGMALFGVSGLLPMSLSGILGDVILAHAGYRELFLTSAAFAATSLALSLPLRDRPPEPDDLPARGFLRAIAERDLLPLWFIGTVFATAIMAFFGFLKTFVLATGVGSVGAFFTAYSISAVVLRLCFGWIPDRIGPKRALFPALGVLALGFLLLAAARDQAAVLAAGACAGLGHGFTFPILAALVVQRARASERGAALALFTSLFDAGVLIGGPLFGVVIRLAGYPTMYAAAATLVAVGAVVFAFWDARHAAARV